MKTLIQRPLFLILLAAAGLILPACGSKGTVKSENVSETVLNPSGTSQIGLPGENTPVKSYVQKIHHRNHSKTSTAPAPVATVAAPPVAPVENIPVKTPAMETAAPFNKKSGSHWFLWILVLLILAGIGWYFWSKKQNEGPHFPSQPKPPVGGVSPVTGFMAVKDRIEEDSQSKPSFWSKKLF